MQGMDGETSTFNIKILKLLNRIIYNIKMDMYHNDYDTEINMYHNDYYTEINMYHNDYNTEINMYKIS